MAALTEREAYEAMRLFLQKQFGTSRRELRPGAQVPAEVSALLDVLPFLDDAPVEPGLWDDWMEAVQQTLNRAGDFGDE